MIGALLIATQFNSTFYTAAVTVIPIFFITLAVELGAARAPVMQRMVALYGIGSSDALSRSEIGCTGCFVGYWSS